MKRVSEQGPRKKQKDRKRKEMVRFWRRPLSCVVRVLVVVFIFMCCYVLLLLPVECVGAFWRACVISEACVVVQTLTPWSAAERLSSHINADSSSTYLAFPPSLPTKKHTSYKLHI